MSIGEGSRLQTLVVEAPSCPVAMHGDAGRRRYRNPSTTAVAIRADRAIGTSFKERKPRPNRSASLRIVLQDFQLDPVVIVHPGAKRYAVADRVEAVPFASLAEPGRILGE